MTTKGRKPASSPQIDSIQSLLEAAENAAENFGNTGIFWRGQPSNHLLLPSVFRTPKHIQNENNYAHRFKLMAPSRHDVCPSSDDLASWLFLMQQYGLPTRLLDWTLSPLVALYFSVIENPDENGEIYALNPINFNFDQIGTPGIGTPSNDSVLSITAEAFTPERTDKPLEIIALHPEEVDPRMRAQMSRFTIHGTTTPIDELPDHQRFLSRYEVPAKEKDALSESLDLLGIREENLFPDLEHLASGIEFFYS